MSDPVISVENLGKWYRIRHQHEPRYVALRDLLASALKSPLRWRRRNGRRADGSTEDFWALENVSFTVGHGEVLGVIGRNGAGKSTLLKILSRITEPTRGSVTLLGRVASLLEVGTGFHNELTGRENIFLNGAILGMRRHEIRRKFDEIVAFAEVEKFLDTPVKRYSSGMYMRLAFAVAAHLEPEILIVDEVLSVGDMDFQRKCLGKMEQVSKSGRTVLFVSHNMSAVKNLSTRAVVLESGRLAFDGPAILAVECYSRYRESTTHGARSWGRGTHSAILGARLLDRSGDPVTDYTPGEPMTVEVTFETDGTGGLSLDLFLLDGARQKLGMASSHHFHDLTLPKNAGRFRTLLELQPPWLASGRYRVDLATAAPNLYWDHVVEDALEFQVVSSNPGGLSLDFKQSLNFGAIALPFVTLPRWMPVGSADEVEPRSDQLFSR